MLNVATLNSIGSWIVVVVIVVVEVVVVSGGEVDIVVDGSVGAVVVVEIVDVVETVVVEVVVVGGFHQLVHQSTQPLVRTSTASKNMSRYLGLIFICYLLLFLFLQ